MLFLSLVLLALAYAVGSLPLGYWFLRRLGVNPRVWAAYNLGVENVIRRLGLGAAITSSALDAAKGFVAVLMASSLHDPALCVLAGLAAYIGHLFPPRFLFGALPPRGRGNLLLLGVLTALYVVGALSLWATVLPLVVWALLLGFTGFTAVATVAGLLVFAVAVSLSALSPAATLGAWLLLAVAAWRFKENLGRILDLTEPRLGEDVPVRDRRPDQMVAAFMVHPLTPDDFWQTGRTSWLKPLVDRGVLSNSSVQRFAEALRPMKMAELRGVRTADGRELRTYIISCPLLPEVFGTQPELATRRAIEGARLAHELGASVFGLGAFWSTVGNKGQDVQDAVPEIAVTNGGAYTSGTIKAAIPAILRHFALDGRDLSQATAAVVGANGVVAFGIARTIAPQVHKIIMVGRDLSRLERSATTLRRANPDTEIVTTTDIAHVREADLVFTATSDPNPVIYPEHVKPGAWIFDEGRPADVHESVAGVPGVRVIPGGVVRPPGNMQTSIDMHFGEGAVPACLAETMIIAINGAYERRSLGAQTLSENVNYFVEEAERLGFQVID